MELKAKFVHDCDGCTLFATDESGDWYVCGDDDDRTVICRHSNKDSDYGSMPVCVGKTVILVGALLRGLVLTEGEARQLLVQAWTHEHDLTIDDYAIAPEDCDSVRDVLRHAVLSTARSTV